MSKRITKVAQCLRKTAATARIPRSLMPDSDDFDASKLSPEMSRKFTEVIQNIRRLDEADQAKDGTMYKHFIFTDIRESAFGAKAFASFLIAAGYDFRMKTELSKTVLNYKPGVPGGCNGFAMLQSLPLWRQPLSVMSKREILRVFNSRPDNIHGELLRLIVLDSKYKEGIDLFDVKYVHLLEPAIATSDLKQAVGRATRFCGQKGLPFAPRRGWPLNVYIYSSILPARAPFQLTEFQGAVEPADAHTFMLAQSGLDLALLKLTKELTMLGIMTSVDYDLNYKINNFSIESAVMDAVEDIDEMVIVELEDRDSSSASANSSVSGSGKKQLAGIYRLEDIDDELLEKCSRGRKSKLFPFTKDSMYRVAQEMGLRVPKSSKRRTYCELLRSNPQFLNKLFARDSAVMADMQYLFDEEKAAKQKRAVNVRTLPVVNHFSPMSTLTASPIDVSPAAASLMDSDLYNSFSSDSSQVPSLIPLSTAPLSTTSLSTTSLVIARDKTPNPLDEFKQLPFDDFQKAVISLYQKHKWDSPVVKSGCDNTQFGKPGTAVSFTHTQDFVRHYLTPDSPFKGLLAWHSVGTGKTCMAVAAATTQFEKAGYTILWVTRNALMADVYKNIFGSVCSIPIMEKLEEKGLPKELKQQKQLLSRSWLAPISYRAFQNALEEKNELGRLLHKNNPGDPLRNTFLIMDEVHKLQDGDLSAAESADFEVIQDFIFKSYTTSGAQSVRPLLMTATPITDNPKELFAVLNTLIPSPDQRLMPFDAFREQYTSISGEIDEEGKRYFQDRAKGLISYLNREFDPTTFSQPVFHTVSVPIEGETLFPTVDVVVDRCLKDIDVDPRSFMVEPRDCSVVERELNTALEQINARELPPKEHKKAVKEVNQTLKREKKECEKHNRGIAKSQKQMRKMAVRSFKRQETEFANTFAKSQVAAVQSCVSGKMTKKAIKRFFVDSDQVVREITRRLQSGDTRGKSRSVQSMRSMPPMSEPAVFEKRTVSEKRTASQPMAPDDAVTRNTNSFRTTSAPRTAERVVTTPDSASAPFYTPMSPVVA